MSNTPVCPCPNSGLLVNYISLSSTPPIAVAILDQLEPFRVELSKHASTTFTTYLITRADSQLTPAAAAMVAAVKAEAKKFAVANRFK